MINDDKKFNNLLNEVKKYLAYLQFERNMSVNTTESYYHDLKYYIEYLYYDKEILCLSKVKSITIKSYINQLSKYSYASNYSHSSINRKISSLKGFHKYLFINNKSKLNISISKTITKNTYDIEL